MAKLFATLCIALIVVIGLSMVAAEEPSNRFFWLRPGAIPWIPINIPLPATAAPAAATTAGAGGAAATT